MSQEKLGRVLEIGIIFSPCLLTITIFRQLGVENPMWFVVAIWLANVIMLLLVWIAIRWRGETWNSIGLTFTRPGIADIGWTVAKSIPIFVFAVAAFVCGSVIMANIAGTPEGPDMSKYNYLQGNTMMLVISLIGSYIVATFGEEVVYRGFLITRLEELFGLSKSLSLIAALVLSSIIFGLAHFEWGLTGMVQTTGMGAALGISYLLVRRQLWPLILAHGYMDTILMVQLYLGNGNAA
jgi:membrane protease YdiL (CAAX protease family)